MRKRSLGRSMRLLAARIKTAITWIYMRARRWYWNTFIERAD